MPRIRTLKPEILDDELTAALTDAEFRCFVGMITLADDHGNVRASPAWIAGKVWWAERHAEFRGDSRRTAGVLYGLAEAFLIELYEVRGQIYAHLCGWEKHQRIDNAGKPLVPLPSDGEAFGERRLAEFRGEPPPFTALPPISDPDLRSQISDPEGAPRSVGSRRLETPKSPITPGLALVPYSDSAPRDTAESARTPHNAANALVGPAKRPRRGRPEPSTEAITCAILLQGRIVENHPESRIAKLADAEREALALKWADTFRLLSEQDGIGWAAIHAMIDYTQRDGFWRTVVLEPKALRNSWEKIRASRTAGHPNAEPPVPKAQGDG